ncbi:MAG TPA: helix-turn-helix domain-containing protein [Solirubrobacterales bacterium]|nr:helix-turn-helix domain-containing protein [Solirubrobacterales bacterium]
MNKGSPEFLNVRETARRLGVHENTVRNWARTGVLLSAKIPGSRFLRFDAADVDRLARNRGASTASMEQERRTIGPELVDATQLHHWAGTKEAQHLFPELMRRLIAATPGLTDVSIRAGEGVVAPGWDGRAESSGTTFLPAGNIFFEFGVSAQPGKKASEDYRKRRKEPLGAVPEESIFVFATPRRWTTAHKWESEKKEDGFFADVRVLDGDALEAWLQQTPAVHHWISERLGRRPRDAATLEQWWGRFRQKTAPPLPADLFLAGRDEEKGKLRKFFAGPPAAIAVQAAWREDALAFINAVVQQLAEEGEANPPLLVVWHPDVWDRVAIEPGAMILVPLFEGPPLDVALDAGHQVVVPVGGDQLPRGEHIRLLRPARQGAMEALKDAGIDSDRAYELAALARRSMPALIRTLARDPLIARPQWSRPPEASVIAPLMLVGAWSPSQEDLSVVSNVVGREWPEIEQALLQWRGSDDPPFIQTGKQWHLASPAEAFLLLSPALTSDVLDRWHKAAKEILLEADPRLELQQEERPMASLLGKVRKHSSTLRGGLAQGLAFAGAAGDVQLSDGESASDHARLVVQEILRRANEDSSGRTWASLADELPLLAEAAPQDFLDAVHQDFDRPQPLLRLMFQDNDQSSALFGSSAHTGLLWALETLCWSPDYLLDASRALARLDAVDPGGRLANRPLNSLSEVLVGWVRHTTAPLNRKVEAVEQTAKSLPDVAWRLIMALWPSHHGVSSPPHSPRFRDWKPESQGVSISEWVEYIGELVRIGISLAKDNAERWAELLEHLYPLPPDHRARLLKAFEKFIGSAHLNPSDQLVLWERLDREIARHRRFPEAEWSMSDDPLTQMEQLAKGLEPEADTSRYAYLFDWRPDLQGFQSRSEEGYDEELEARRRAAVKEVLAADSLDPLQKLAERSRVPMQLGFTIGAVASGDFDDLIAWLDADNDKLRDVASSWAGSRLNEGGVAWLREVLSRPDMKTSERRIVVATAAPATAEVWNALAEIDPELSVLYWKKVNPWRVSFDDTERAVLELLGAERPWAAVDLLNASLHQRKQEKRDLPHELFEKVLDAALTSDGDERPAQSPGYEVGELLDYLEDTGYSAENLLKYEYGFFRLLDDYRQPKALYKRMRESPDLFVQLVARVYRGRNDEKRKLNKEDQELAQHAWWVLEHWREVPGRREDGSVDGDHLSEWVDTARLALAELDRADIGDEMIGRLLSASPEGEDGGWPSEPVRELIERVGSTSIETGMEVGIFNGRGITSRSPYDGGQQERELAQEYRVWARKTAASWPRTSRVLRSIAESFERDAKHHDVRAEISGDIE